ncbi:DNA/RNA non-specific endonuclease [Abyssalbus ytuae]|uniref:DNA/RNA non-specific endonuclease n=1 Tax=Abyssalbus ytuae TaxID=2926907 RepID=A0A9E6ZPY4_9FLAO|nr:DNA/RNA non-specific endonuclease [Abyssalbus ytuae]UOB18405.1 DNA/RNA non-specific endonuclease [Abyssalbus ytuae]
MAYAANFIEGFEILPPKINESEKQKFGKEIGNEDNFYLEYSNFSLLHNPLRKFAYYTAANIDGEKFKKITRKDIFPEGRDKWQKDNRISGEYQLGHELYKAVRSDFDKGHLTKREDVQWGENENVAIQAARSTFYFTNAVPQVDRLNRGIWKQIENYILHSEVVKNNFKVSLFTGPVLQEQDPCFVTKVNKKVLRLPYLFWKVIYYLKNDKLFYTGFLTSQKGLLEKKRIIEPVNRCLTSPQAPFLNFKDAETYQVNIALIEKLTRLNFTKAGEVFKNNKPEKLILAGIDIRSGKEMDFTNVSMNVKL